MQRVLIFLAIALSAGTANASLLKYDLEAAIVEPFASNWTGPGALPNSMRVSFLLDTQSAPATFNFVTSNGVSCVGHYEATGLKISNIAVYFNGQPYFLETQNLMGLGGDNANSSCPNPGFFAFMSGPRVGWFYDAVSTLTAEQLIASSDPLGDFLVNLAYKGFTILSASGDWGNVVGGVTKYSVSRVPVPEPATAGLFALGAALLIVVRRRQPLR